MDGRQYAERRRAMALFGFAIRNPGASRGLSGAEVAFKAEGTQPIVNRGVVVNNDPLEADQMILAEEQAAAEVPAPVPTPASVKQQLLTATDQLLAYHASVNQAPTRGARINYLFLLGAASAYSWVTSAASVTGTKDNWNWATKNILGDDSSQAIFLTNALVKILTKINASYDATVLRSALTPQQLAAEATVLATGAYTTWSTAYDTWWTGRAADGNTTAAPTPTTTDISNASITLDVTTTQDITAYPNPTQWTSLTVGGARKNYLTMNWNSVTSTGLSGAQETTIQNAANTEYLSNPTARNTEIADLLALHNSLTDHQKIIAEFWAGGPGTPSPPGIAIWFWRYAVAVNGATTYQTVYSGLELAIGLFEASRLAWGVKKQQKEARPIQMIRKNFTTTDVTVYKGTSSVYPTTQTVKGNMWFPYQMANFVTPPFPDFVSGHSTFSQTLANVMTSWFGATLPSQTFAPSNIELVAPVLQNEITLALTYFPVAAGASEIQPGEVPAAPLTLTFATWQDVADSAGISRLYGGIHCQSANAGGKALANALTPALATAWGIAKA